MPFKIIVINNKCKLSYKDNYLLIDDKKKDFLDYIKLIIINSLQVSVSPYLINELMKRNICLIYCDENKNPLCTVINLYSTNDLYKKLNEQIYLSNNNKEYVWSKIVYNKIYMQQKLLFMCTKVDKILDEYMKNIELGDRKNCEAFAARKYFNMLFGIGFNRRINSNINFALNYGYTILLSMVNRVIISLGYNTVLGIKHCNQHNNFNFSCDIMEHFRPIIIKLLLKK